MVFGMLQDVVKSATNPANVIKNKGVNTAINTSLSGKGKASPFSWSKPLGDLLAQQTPKVKPTALPKPKAKLPKQPQSAGNVDLMKGKWTENKHGIGMWRVDGLGRDVTMAEYQYVKNRWKKTNDPMYDRYRTPKQPKPELNWRGYEPKPGEFLY